MAVASIERRLAAILSADVVGYGRLMAEDESGTLERLKAHRRELIDPEIAAHHGRIVKLMGDGALVEFASVVDAVQCAAEIQRGMVKRNAAIAPEHRIDFRVGINLGDVIVEGDDIYGDGVNVAARLETLAEPGGICISDVVQRSVQGKVELGFDDLGEQRVKNIAEPVRAYRVRMDPGAAGVTKAIKPRRVRWLVALAVGGVLLAAIGSAGWRFYLQPLLQERSFAEQTALPLPDKPSIAVLPFDNMSADPAQEYFSDGITESLITHLSQLSGLFVIARNTAFTYKDHPVNVPQVGRELGVRYVLEGSVQRADDRVRITAQLIDAATGFHVWADRYDRELKDVFALQDEVTETIVSALEIELTENDRQGLTQRYTNSLEAYDLFLRGLEQYWQFSVGSNQRARGFFEQAIALDPNFALAYANLAMTYSGLGFNLAGIDDDALRGRALWLAQKAVELDDSLPQVHLILSNVYLQRREYARAMEAIERAIALDPNYADAYAMRGDILQSIGRPEDALASLDHAMRLNPRFPFPYLMVKGEASFSCALQFDETPPCAY
jgi:adenylate cyclase